VGRQDRGLGVALGLFRIGDALELGDLSLSLATPSLRLA